MNILQKNMGYYKAMEALSSRASNLLRNSTNGSHAYTADYDINAFADSKSAEFIIAACAEGGENIIPALESCIDECAVKVLSFESDDYGFIAGFIDDDYDIETDDRDHSISIVYWKRIESHLNYALEIAKRFIEQGAEFAETDEELNA